MRHHCLEYVHFLLSILSALIHAGFLYYALVILLTFQGPEFAANLILLSFIALSVGIYELIHILRVCRSSQMSCGDMRCYAPSAQQQATRWGCAFILQCLVLGLGVSLIVRMVPGPDGMSDVYPVMRRALLAAARIPDEMPEEVSSHQLRGRQATSLGICDVFDQRPDKCCRCDMMDCCYEPRRPPSPPAPPPTPRAPPHPPDPPPSPPIPPSQPSSPPPAAPAPLQAPIARAQLLLALAMIPNVILLPLDAFLMLRQRTRTDTNLATAPPVNLATASPVIGVPVAYATTSTAAASTHATDLAAATPVLMGHPVTATSLSNTFHLQPMHIAAHNAL